MCRSQFALVWWSVFAALVGCGATQAAPAQDLKDQVVWIYRDVPGKDQKDARSEPERLFAPFGLMPPERAAQISVNQSAPAEADDMSKGTQMEFVFKFREATDWVGAYMLLDGGTAWGTKEGINVQKILGVPADFKLALRFKAKGKGTVTFKIGGVNVGAHPSSLGFAREVADSPMTLTNDYREYTIGPIPAGDLTNLIDPFCVVTSILDNRGRTTVEVAVDDLRIEPFEKRVP